ncbi:hypothetical protein ACOHYD_04335 [Desulfobacterota bacterium M19]
MIYIHAIGIHNTVPSGKLPDLTGKLKSIGGSNRRSDHFIQLAVIGAHKAVEGHQLRDQTAVYMTSGQGNTAVFNRVYNSLHIKKDLPKPVDFINLLSNSAGFYVADHLGLHGKNIFLSHHHFPVQMTMLATQNDLTLGKQKAILAGGVDEWLPRQDLARRLSGVSETTTLGEGSNWMLLNSQKEGAIATFELPGKWLLEDELHKLLAAEAENNRSFIAFAKRVPAGKTTGIMSQYPEFARYNYEESCACYETLSFYALNSFLAGNKKGRLLHIDVSAGHYMVMAVEIIP